MAEPGGSALHGAWTTPDVCSGALDMSKIDPQAQKRADTKRTTGLPTEAAMWMTPSVSNSQGNEYTRDRGQEGQERLTLAGQASHWPSPNVQDAEAAGGQGAIGRGTRGETLHTMTAQWPTPASRDFRTPNSQESQESRTIHGGEQLPNFVEHHFSHPVLSTLDGRPLSPTARTLRRRLNPAFACWLMGWPIWWTNPALTSCAKSAMASWRHALALHLRSYCEGQA